MALKDFNEYLFKVNEQVLAAKEDLKDFEQGLKDGYVTEDKLEAIKEEYARMNINLQRLLYCSYLLSLPNRKSKQKRYRAQNKKIEVFMANQNATDSAVFDENESALNIIREEIKQLNK